MQDHNTCDPEANISSHKHVPERNRQYYEYYSAGNFELHDKLNKSRSLKFVSEGDQSKRPSGGEQHRSAAVARAMELLGEGSCEAAGHRWRRDTVSQRDAELAKAAVMRHLGVVTQIPLGTASIGEVTGFRDIPRESPEIPLVKPPWNYDKPAKFPLESFSPKRRSTQAGSSSHSLISGKSEPKTPHEHPSAAKIDAAEEVMLTKDIRDKIASLDKRIRRIERLQKGPRHGVRFPALHQERRSGDMEPEADSGLSPEPRQREAARRNAPAKLETPKERKEKLAVWEKKAATRSTVELIRRNTRRCVEELKKRYKALLRAEEEEINAAKDMPWETKLKLLSYVRTLVMQRIELEVEQKKLFEWPDEGIKKYALAHIRAERQERMRQLRFARDRSRTTSAASSMKYLRAASAFRKVRDQQQSFRWGPASGDPQEDREDASGNKGSSNKSGTSNSSQRGKSTPLSVVHEDEKEDSPRSGVLQMLAGIDDNDEDEDEISILEGTLLVIDMVAERAPVDVGVLQSVTKLNLSGKLVGRIGHARQLQRVLPLCRNLKSLVMSCNDLGASSFHGIMDAMYRAPCLPLEELDLSVNCLGADGGSSVAPLTVYLGRVQGAAGGPGHRIRVLNLRACMLGDNGAMTLAAGLPSASTIQELDLSENLIGDSGVKAITKTLKAGCNMELSHLSLAYNNIGRKGVHLIGSMLESESQALRFLDLSWNPHVGQAGMERLALSLLDNTTLEELRLEACEIGDGAIEAIVLLSWVNTGLQVLRLQTNEFTLHGKRRLWGLLKCRSSAGGNRGSPQRKPGPADRLPSPSRSGISLTVEELAERVRAGRRGEGRHERPGSGRKRGFLPPITRDGPYCPLSRASDSHGDSPGA